ncbi:LacI family transcriptional regulator [Rhodovulum iodosum]|uniref:LacI family transcriptional regulator n=1 Tax=Rhodovulum iodosum TaxID=68291 RepID=A0ABV3XUQ5_9RHOB|nr:LacI family DNA-binding transcriptional regulator [Rhodovulum robiginosum]RSK35117.1 LacI family transcriptional regulator [Rhodovulum robiginosum]
MNLKELAAHLGLSQTTVSRALNGYPEVAEATRLRVREAAQRHGYRPNARARSLATGRSLTLGHVLSATGPGALTAPGCAGFVAGCGAACREAGYEMLLSVAHDAAEEETAYRELAARRAVDGVIVHAPRENDPRPALLAGLGLPFAVHGRTGAPEDSYQWVDENHRRSVRLALNSLAGLGHLRIALINGPEDDLQAAQRLHWVLRLTRKIGLDLAPAHIVATDLSEAAARDAAQRLLAADAPPTAFLAASAASGIGVRRALAERGATPGREASLIVFDAGPGDPSVTALRYPAESAGRRAAELLLKRIAQPGTASAPALIGADFVEGASTGPAPQDA